MHRVVRNWKASLQDTLQAVQKMALRGRGTSPAEPLQLPLIIVEAVHTNSLKTDPPTGF